MVIVSEYTGDSLRDCIVSSQVLQYKTRDFVQAVLEYCASSEVRVLSISGLRGTGKTTGICCLKNTMIKNIY